MGGQRQRNCRYQSVWPWPHASGPQCCLKKERRTLNRALKAVQQQTAINVIEPEKGVGLKTGEHADFAWGNFTITTWRPGEASVGQCSKHTDRVECVFCLVGVRRRIGSMK